MNYGELIGDAFRVAWRNRFLWFFGFFISGGVASFNASIPPNPDAVSNPTAPGLPVWLFGFFQWARENVVLAVALGAGLLLVLLLVFVGLSLISTGGLADSVAAIDGGEGRNFSSTWRAGVRNVWRVLGYGVLFFLIGLVPLIVVVVPAGLGILAVVSLTESEVLSVVFVPIIVLAAFALVLVATVALYLVGQLALRELVVGGRGIVASIEGGYRLFRRNLGLTLVVWIIQFAIALAVTVAVAVVGFVVNLVQTFGFMALSYTAPYPLVVALAIGVGLILSLPLIVVGAAIGVFNHAYWTLVYLRLTTPPTTSPGPLEPVGPQSE